MSDGKKENGKMSSKTIFSVFVGPLVSVVLFVLLYAVVIPRTTAQEEINENRTRISVVETNVITVIKQIDAMNDKIERILDLLLKTR